MSTITYEEEPHYLTLPTFFFNVLSVEKGEPVAVDADSLTRELLDSSQCYILDCGMEVFVWVGKST